MREADAWAQWWALAWRHAHPDWISTAQVDPALARNQHASLGKAFAIVPCLPGKPSASLIYLALAQPEQHDFMLQLVATVCCPMLASPLDAPRHLWCQRLAKALRPQGWLKKNDDALQLLRVWVEPPVWQRLRLRFAPARVMALEQQPLPEIPPTRLQLLWQAVLWYEHRSNPEAASSEVQGNAVTTHD